MTIRIIFVDKEEQLFNRLAEQKAISQKIELRKRFYKGFSDYLYKHYEKNYYEYHTSLLKNPPHYKHNYRLKKNRDCDLGRITYILCFQQ